MTNRLLTLEIDLYHHLRVFLPPPKQRSTVNPNKNRLIPFCDIFKSYKPILMIFIGCIENIFKFFLKNFCARNFYPRRNFYEKPTNDFYENLKKTPYDVEKSFFSKLAPNLR